MKRILVTGSRNWDKYRSLLEAIEMYSSPGDTLVHGACPSGADLLANAAGLNLGLKIEAHPADWEKHGRAAGPIRNQQMVDLGADVCLAFLMEDSRGTRDCIKRVRAAGIKVIEFDYEECEN